MSGGSQKFNIITVMNPAAQSHIVANLKKYTKYEFFIAPFYKTVEGQPSNSKVAQTFEDGMWNNSALFAQIGLKWFLNNTKTLTVKKRNEREQP